MAIGIAFFGWMSFGIAQQPSVLNQDGSVNSPVNRAARGETVQLLLARTCADRGSHSANPKPIAHETVKANLAQAAKEITRPRVIMDVQPAEVLSSSFSPEFPGMWKVIARVPTPSDDQEPLRDETPYIVFLDGSTESLGNLWVEP